MMIANRHTLDTMETLEGYALAHCFEKKSGDTKALNVNELQEEVEETKVRRAPIYKKLCGGVLRVCRLLCRISPVAQALPSASPPGLMKRMSSQSEASTCLHGCGDHTVASAHLVVPWHGCVILSSWFNLGGSRRRKVGQASEGAAYGRCVAVHPGHGHRPTC